MQREGDSNPRWICIQTCFPSMHLQPLRHLSIRIYNQFEHDKIIINLQRETRRITIKKALVFTRAQRKQKGAISLGQKR